MTRRWRIRLVWLSIILGVPAAVACVAISLVWTGQVERLITTRYHAMLPGDLSVGSLVVVGADEIELRNVAIRDGSHTPLVEARTVWMRLDMVRGAPLAIRVEGVRGTLDRQNLALLNAITDATSRMPESNPPLDFTIESDCSADLPQGLKIRDSRVVGRVQGPLFEIDGTATFDGRPVKVQVWNRPIQGSIQNRRIGVELLEVQGPGRLAVKACADLGLLPEAPEGILALVPELVDVSGSLVTRDVGVFRFGTDADVRWGALPSRAAGRLRTRLDADAHRVQFTNLRLDDGDLGRIGHTSQGPAVAMIDLVKNHFTLQGPAVLPGPRLPLPPGLPLESLVASAPRLYLTLGLEGTSGAVVLSGLEGSQSRASATWGQGQPLRIAATELPLSLGQQFLPPSVTLTGGIASTMTLVLDVRSGLGQVGLIEATATVRQARGTLAGWGVGPLDGDLRATPADDGLRFQITMPQGTIDVTGGMAGARATLELSKVEAFLALLHGPMELPDIRGQLGVSMAWRQDGAQRKITVQRLTLGGVGLPDRLRRLAGTLTGRVSWAEAAPLSINLGGQLTGGELLLPGGWLDLAARSPIFALDLDLTPPTGADPGWINLRQLLVRGATPNGKPVEGAYSAEFRGRLTLEGSGTAEGLVDHADLDWINRHATRGGALATGQGAITCTAELREGAVTRVVGHFLPLDVDLTIGQRFRASGITGAVAFTLDQPAPPPTKGTP